MNLKIGLLDRQEIVKLRKKKLTRRVDFHLADILHIIIVYDAPNSFICFNYFYLLQFVFNFALQIIFSLNFQVKQNPILMQVRTDTLLEKLFLFLK